MAQALVYIAAASVASLLAAAATLRTGFLRLESKLGVARDGIREGRQAPRWRQADADGEMRESPNPTAWQVLVFSDHSLKEFPGLAVGLADLMASYADAEVLMLVRRDSEIKIEAARAVLEAFELDIPIMPVDERVYWKYNIRVLPLVLIVDPIGTVGASGLVNEPTHLMAMWKYAKGVRKESLAYV